ncbi:MAG: DNA polymerase III subunit epsilon [Giesbergeria sp.]|nr:DNA polymerase III subunit epsilon [Giesbergeria sp.]
MSRQIFLDTETTGLSAEGGDRVIEIGCVEMVARKPTGNNRHFYLNPGRDSHPDALRVHGITTEFLRDKPQFSAVADDLLEYLQGAEVIIHNAPFDVGFLNKELELLGRAPLKTTVGSVIDTMLMAKEMYPGKRNSLDALCDRLGVDNSGRTLHGALLDAELLADVYICLTRGQEALLIADDEGEDANGQSLPRIDLRGIDLPVLHASVAECAAHAQMLEQLDKASGGKTIWRLTQSVEKAVP